MIEGGVLWVKVIDIVLAGWGGGMRITLQYLYTGAGLHIQNTESYPLSPKESHPLEPLLPMKLY